MVPIHSRLSQDLACHSATEGMAPARHGQKNDVTGGVRLAREPIAGPVQGAASVGGALTVTQKRSTA